MWKFVQIVTEQKNYLISIFDIRVIELVNITATVKYANEFAEKRTTTTIMEFSLVGRLKEIEKIESHKETL